MMTRGNQTPVKYTTPQAGLAVASSTLCLVVAIYAMSCDDTSKNSRTPENLWAEAILLSIPYDEMDSTTVANLYLEAIEKSTRKAPLLVSFGDFLSGPLCTMEEFNSFTEKVIKQSDVELVKAGANKIVDQMSGDDESMACYKLALKHDPAYLPAWNRLATEAEGVDAEDAIEWFCFHQPNNALGWYLRASRAVDAKRFDLALDDVERGNLCDEFITFPPEFPQQSSVAYPPIELYKDAAGKSVPTSTIEFLLSRQNNWFGMDPLYSSIRDIVWDFAEQARLEAASGNDEQAVRLCVSAYFLGKHMVQCEPPNGLMSISGVAVATKAVQVLQEVSLSESQQLLEIEHDYQEIKTYLKLFRSRYLAAEKQLSSVNLVDILLGTVRPESKKREILIKILKEAGLN